MVLWIGFYHIGPILLYVDLFLCVYLYVFCVFLIHLHSYINVSVVGWTWWDWSL